MYLKVVVKKVENMYVSYQKEKKTDFKFYQDELYRKNQREMLCIRNTVTDIRKKKFDRLINRLKRAKERRMSKHENGSIEINHARL